jgi:hypothetical protein
MATLKKATPEQAYLKVGWYGSQGSGKTLTSLLVGEWLIEQEKKNNPGKDYRMAFVDTERGTDFYARDVKERKIHPKAFDFDRIVTRSVYEVKELLLDMKNDADNKYKVVIIDSMTHLWEAAKGSWTGKKNDNDQPPYYAWASIKKPVKAIMDFGLNAELHYMFCGREGMVFEKDEDSGEDQMTGYKMKAESESAYEPHVLIQMYQYRNMKSENWSIRAFFEKDRSGCLTGKTIEWPKGDLLAPLFALLAGKQGTFTSTEDSSSIDARKAYEEKEEKEATAASTYDHLRNNIAEAKTKRDLKTAWGLVKGHKTLLGVDRFDALSALTDARIAALTQEHAATERATLAKEN